jgi:hypothetical protein
MNLHAKSFIKEHWGSIGHFAMEESARNGIIDALQECPMPFDGPDFLDIVFFAERASGLKLRNLPAHRLRAADAAGGLSVADVADLFCATAATKDAPPAPCPCITRFEALRRTLNEQLRRPLQLHPDTPLRDIQNLLPKEYQAELFKALDVDDYIISHAGGALLIMWFATALWLTISLRGSWWYVPLCILSSCIITVVACRLLRGIMVRHGRLPRFLTLSDLTCATLLESKRDNPHAGPWTRSDIRLLARFAVAQQYYRSVRDVRLRQRIRDL